MKVPKKVKEMLAAIPPLLLNMAQSEITQAEELTTQSLKLKKAISQMETEDD